MAIALVRIKDNRVMNIREGSDWRKALFDARKKITKYQQLQAWQKELEETPEKNVTRRKDLQRGIDGLQASWDRWIHKRKEICAKRYGGVPADYSTVDVPQDDYRAFAQARYVEYDGENLTYDVRPLYYIEGSKITCTSGWVKENECLLEDDETDFSALNLEEPMYFQLWFAQNKATQEISVQLLVRSEDQDFSNFPENLTRLWREPICEGRVNIDHTITLGRF
jgi:hypothetical protein